MLWVLDPLPERSTGFRSRRRRAEGRRRSNEAVWPMGVDSRCSMSAGISDGTTAPPARDPG